MESKLIFIFKNWIWIWFIVIIKVIIHVLHLFLFCIIILTHSNFFNILIYPKIFFLNHLIWLFYKKMTNFIVKQLIIWILRVLNFWSRTWIWLINRSSSKYSPFTFIIININIKLPLAFIAFTMAFLNSYNISNINQMRQVLLLICKKC